MRDLLELQTGQVSFLSGLLAGFALSIAVHILRHGLRDTVAQIVFLLLIAVTLLFLVSLYVDVRLSIELAGLERMDDTMAARVSAIRFYGTTSATVAFALFVLSIGLLGWIATPLLGFVTSILAIIALGVLGMVWYSVQFLNQSAVMGLH